MVEVSVGQHNPIAGILDLLIRVELITGIELSHCNVAWYVITFTNQTTSVTPPPYQSACLMSTETSYHNSLSRSVSQLLDLYDGVYCRYKGCIL